MRGRDLIKSWAVPVLLAVVALAFDAADRRVPFSILADGALDEVAHLATGALGLLALSCFIDAPRRFYMAGLIASVAIDLDHIPMYLGVGNPNQRPVTHSLATILVVVVAAALNCRHRAVLVGAATGLLVISPETSPRGARRKDAMAASGHSMDGQLQVVPGNDHRVYRRAADPGNSRHPSHAYLPVSAARSGQILLPPGSSCDLG